MFAGFPGFREVRQVKSKGVAFVEYESPNFASTAKTQSAQTAKEVLGERVTVSFAKK